MNILLRVQTNETYYISLSIHLSKHKYNSIYTLFALWIRYILLDVVFCHFNGYRLLCNQRTYAVDVSTKAV